MRNSITYVFTLTCILAMSTLSFAQNAPIDFEDGGHGASWTWTVFENHTNPALEIVDNPNASGDNTSAKVAKFTAVDSGAAWAGCESAHGSDIGTYNLDASNSTIKIMVYKSIISDVGIKLVKPDGWSMGEIKVSNTVTNEWEELTFDMSSQIQDGYDQIVIFPDFNLDGRLSTNICYFDNITFSGQVEPSTPDVAAPTPTVSANDVISIFSDAYTNIPGTDLNPNWGQGTVVSQVYIQGDTTMLYSGLNYQGIALGSNQNVSDMGFLHVDFWSSNSTTLNVFLISPGPVETSYALTVPTTGWASVDIPLSAFSPVDLADVFQLKFDGNGDIYLDNIYFSKTVSAIEEIKGSIPSAYAMEQNYPNPFNPNTKIKFSLPQANHTVLKVYNLLGQEVATLLNESMNAGTFEVTFEALNLTSGTYIYSISSGNFTAVKKMMLIK